MSGQDTSLANIPVGLLLGEVLRRPGDLFNEKGFLSREAFALADILSIRCCVDGIAVRRGHAGEIEAMAIRRNTGPFAGKLCLVGGGISKFKGNGQWLPESAEEALRRHFKRDLGFEIEPVET